jgi:hypothetical protein
VPIKEAVFWFGLTIFGAGLYVAVEGGNVNLAIAILLMVLGLAASAYSVYRHHHPEKQLPGVSTWVIFLVVTWCVLGYDIYENRFAKFVPVFELGPEPKWEHVRNQTFVNETIEVDGKQFEDCKFNNVHLVFHGRKAFSVIHADFIGTIAISSDDRRLSAFGELLSVFGIVGGPGVAVYYDAHKNWVGAKIFQQGTGQITAPTNPKPPAPQ